MITRRLIVSGLRQRGVAALEFALIATLMIVLLLGLLVFWNAFQTQQSLNRAAGDGARHALTLITSTSPPCDGSNAGSNRVVIQSTVQTTIRQHLTQSGLDANQFSMPSPATWDCSKGEFKFDVEYTLHPLLGGSSSWLAEPTKLHISDRIVVHFKVL